MTISSDWLRLETPEHLRLLTRLRNRLAETLDTDLAHDADGVTRGTPSRDWCRAYARYHQGYATLLVEERERAKLVLLARRSGQVSLTDDEYELELRKLKSEALGELSTADLASEFLRRGMALPVSSEHEDPD